MSPSELRRTMKTQRRALSVQQWTQTSQAIAQQIKSQIWFQRSQHIGFYLPMHGEVDTQSLIEQAWQMGKTCYLPALHPLRHNSLWFLAYLPHQLLVENRFGIPEPKIDSRSVIIPSWALNLLFLPIVAFDSAGHRMGTGGGYYDRTLAFVNEIPQKPRPLLVGLAHEFQRVAKIDPETWDIGMDYVATELTIYASECVVKK